MSLSFMFRKRFAIHGAGICAFGMLLISAVGAQANPNYSMTDFESFPINIIKDTTKPKVMLNASNDHQLFFKAYNDYSDLDSDGDKEITYAHKIDYYGYFDSYKCYKYDNSDERFEPYVVTTDKYCNAGLSSGQWSGNFLNWASMSRIDSIRKILFGGHRRVDSATETVLERSYLPHDAHSWAKYYDGADIPKLTPFSPGGTGVYNYNCDQGDLTRTECLSSGTLDKKKIGITIGNTTDVDTSLYNNKYSEEYEEPPLIKVVKGNYSLWASNERWQVTWSSGAPIDNRSASNGNNPNDSGIYAYASSPAYNQGIGEKNYVARVVACDSGTDSNGKSLIGQEKCKLYPGPDGIEGTSDDNYKPIGLLQTYGDKKEMEFGMVAGSYNKHASGGVVIKTMRDLHDEINVGTDGTFSLVSTFASDNGVATNQSDGLINAWSSYRIIGYDGAPGEGLYNSADNCPWGLSAFGDVTKDNACRNWGNPFSEIYYQSINYLAYGGVIGPYRSNSSTGIPGLPVPQSLSQDPIDADEYCAKLNVINLNSSVFSYDWDELDATSYGPDRIWDSNDLPGDKSTTAMTNYVGASEGINGNDYFLGEIDVTNQSDSDDQLCTDKTITNFGKAGGHCPEAPRLQGSFRIAGLAYYAHTKDIRPASANSRKLEGPQTVDTYSVALATALPVLEIPDPANHTNTLATIIPACRNTDFNPEGNCAIVDYKIVDQDLNSGTGEVFIVWEDSEQGGDYDQDMWGTLKYTVDTTSTPAKISVTTNVISESTPYDMGFGYVLGGTTSDGFHAHSGIEGYTSTETADTGSPDCSGTNGCQPGDAPSTKTYTLGTSTAKLLKDPLWYASKWGGFLDSNGNNLPDLVTEWDSKINSTWVDGSDGIPDNYFLASNPKQLEEALDRVLSAILERTSSGTAAAVVSSNVRGEGALYQAYYEPLKKDGTKEARWVGTVQSLWLDSYGLTRQDCSPPATNIYDPATATTCPAAGTFSCGVPNGQLDDYCVDNVVETYYDDVQGRTRVKVYNSNEPDTFSAVSMQGVVNTYATGAGTGATTVLPNYVNGTSVYDTATKTMTLSPYELTGTITAYDSTTGIVTLSVPANSWTGPASVTYTGWQANISTGAGVYYTEDAITIAANPALQVTLSPIDLTLVAGATLTLYTKDLNGKEGETFDNWVVQCLDGSGIEGEVNSSTLVTSNSSVDSFVIENPTGNFFGCSQARLVSYDMQGTEGDSYSDWYVANLDTVLGTGTSTSPLTLTNDQGLLFNVNPKVDWLARGDRILLSNYSFTTVELYELNYLWNGREELTALDPAWLTSNRNYAVKADVGGRHITTWIDDNLDGIVDTGEFRDFDKSWLDAVNYNFFDVASQAIAGNVIDYIRGIEVSGMRSRTIKYRPTDLTAGVMRLGDIINSTPTVVGSPQEAFDLLYGDSTYSAFRKLYQDRRVVVYVGGNDGLLHAFNGGFYNVVTSSGNKTVQYDVNGFKSDGTTAATAHALGTELWAYAPKNLLPHLQWLTDSANYPNSHVYYIDGKPRVFDANIFTASTSHPNGWGTVMVVGMNLGGGKMEIDADTNQDGVVDATDADVAMHSAYMVFDITDPEEEPVLLGEIPLPDESFTSVYPSVVAFRDMGTATNCSSNTKQCNQWYLMFGTGPDDIKTYDSSQNAKLYLFDLNQLTTGPAATPTVSTSVPASCTVKALGSTTGTTKYNVIECDTAVSNTFVGTPMVVDWELDFYGNTAYFGLVGDDSATQGRVMRLDFNNAIDSASWSTLTTFFDAGRPVVGQPVPSIDDLDRKWLYFGTGRYYTGVDKINTSLETLYGIQDDGVTVASTGLLDVSTVEVYSDGSLDASMSASPLSSTVSTFKELENEIDTNSNIKGWKIELPQLSGVFGTDPSTRNTTRSALLGGVLFTSVFQPSEDPCEGEGLSRMYGLYYKTGTAYPDPSVFGSSTVIVSGQLKYQSNKFIDLGLGIATAPAIHSGTGTGSDTVKVFTQLSTGDIIQSEADTVQTVRTGKTSWSDR